LVSKTSGQGIRQRLSELLKGDLAFRNGSNSYLLNSLHAYAARFPGQLPQYFVEGLSSPGETLLDPMAGSGVSLVEGWLLSRNVIGVDLDDLAVRLCKAKTTPMEPQIVRMAGQRVVDTALLVSSMGDPLGQVLAKLTKETRVFIDYWFTPQVQKEVAALVLAIREEKDPRLRLLLEVLLSSIIVTKSGGVSMARDLAHSRPHRVSSKTPRSAIKMFQVQVQRAVQAFQQIRNMPTGNSLVLRGDSRFLPLGSNSVDLIVTSPPYANALDYVRAHKFSLVWLGEPVERLSRLRGHYIGAERWREIEGVLLPGSVQHTISALAAKDPQKGRVLDRYLRDMTLALREMHRVLRPGRAAVLVVGPSVMRGMPIETHIHLAAIAEGVGFDVVGIARRPLDRDRRMMPARHQGNGHSSIERRIHQEFVVLLVKGEEL